jgi:hypothetical protein
MYLGALGVALAVLVVLLVVVTVAMETLEMIGWISLGFVPSYLALEVGTRKLARRISAKLFLNQRGNK